MTRLLAQVLMLFGAVLILLASIGIVRFRDVLARMHALSKASTFGLILVLIGGTVGLDELNDISFVLVAIVFQLLTAPVGASLITRATYRASHAHGRVDGADELAPPDVDTGGHDG
ncbi:monovalent cation/H(+) antiporter subunit G [soil metagenome]